MHAFQQPIFPVKSYLFNGPFQHMMLLLLIEPGRRLDALWMKGVLCRRDQAGCPGRVSLGG